MRLRYTTLTERAKRVQDPEIALRFQTIRLGIYLTSVVAIGIGIYAMATWDQENRDTLLLIAPIALAAILPVPLLPLAKILARPVAREAFFFTWTTLDLALVAIAVSLDGGLTSPLALLLVLPLLFSSMSYPLTLAGLAGVIAITTISIVAVVSGDEGAVTGLAAFAMFCASLMAIWGAQLQLSRRQELTSSIEARTRSERRSSRQAEQQEAVARFGRSALAKRQLADVFSEALEIIARILEVDFGTILALDEGRRHMDTVALIGLDEKPGERSTPLDGGMLTGHAVLSREPVTVEDWGTEERFERPIALARVDATSSVAVSIEVAGTAWGALSAHTVAARKFPAEDIAFTVAMANVLGSAIDRHGREEQIRYTALHDPLTGLANRSLFEDRLRNALARARRRSSMVAVMFIDLDDFKLVNDSLGHEAGDQLLRTVAPRLSEAVRAVDTVARFGGDEFTILLEDVADEGMAREVADRILSSLNEPFELGGSMHEIGGSVGIAIGNGQSSPEGLMRDADTALYSAKEKTKGTAELFDDEARARVVERVRTEQDLRGAIARDEMELHYQPIIDVARSRIAGFEGLIRWRHPKRGLLAPGTFIPLAEEVRLINEIGAWVIQRACQDAAEWIRFAPPNRSPTVSVNLSARQLVDRALPGIVRSALDSTGLPPRLLHLELTESLLIEESGLAMEMIEALRGLEVGLVLDDFGTGFSSMSYLKRLPLEALKLDRSFVASLGTTSPDAAIATATVTLAKALDMHVIAEGVETAEQLEALTELGCPYAQGFFFSKAVPIDQVPPMIHPNAPLPRTSNESQSEPAATAAPESNGAGSTAPESNGSAVEGTTPAAAEVRRPTASA